MEKCLFNKAFYKKKMLIFKVLEICTCTAWSTENKLILIGKTKLYNNILEFEV